MSKDSFKEAWLQMRVAQSVCVSVCVWVGSKLTPVAPCGGPCLRNVLKGDKAKPAEAAAAVSMAS